MQDARTPDQISATEAIVETEHDPSGTNFDVLFDPKLGGRVAYIHFDRDLKSLDAEKAVRFIVNQLHQYAGALAMQIIDVTIFPGLERVINGIMQSGEHMKAAVEAGGDVRVVRSNDANLLVKTMTSGAAAIMQGDVVVGLDKMYQELVNSGYNPEKARELLNISEVEG